MESLTSDAALRRLRDAARASLDCAGDADWFPSPDDVVVAESADLAFVFEASPARVYELARELMAARQHANVDRSGDELEASAPSSDTISGERYTSGTVPLPELTFAPRVDLTGSDVYVAKDGTRIKPRAGWILVRPDKASDTYMPEGKVIRPDTVHVSPPKRGTVLAHGAQLSDDPRPMPAKGARIMMDLGLERGIETGKRGADDHEVCYLIDLDMFLAELA